jgi:hypothetical protein
MTPTSVNDEDRYVPHHAVHALARESRTGFTCVCGVKRGNEAAFLLHIEVNS